MLEQELNKKLAEWAGFEKGEGRKIFRKEGGWVYTETNIWWLTPMVGKYRGEWEHLPYFTQSLDACFKWLVKDNWSVSFNAKRVCLLTIPKAKGIYGSDVIVGKAEQPSPALALCLAIEKLIDSGVK